MSMKSIKYAFLVLAAFIQSATAEPASWTVKDNDTTIILYGTFHVAKADMKWLSRETVKRLEKTDRLYLELSPEQSDEAVITPAILEYAILPPNQTLRTILPAKTKNDLVNYLRSRNIPANSLDQFRPCLRQPSLRYKNMRPLDMRVNLVLKKK